MNSLGRGFKRGGDLVFLLSMSSVLEDLLSESRLTVSVLLLLPSAPPPLTGTVLFGTEGLTGLLTSSSEVLFFPSPFESAAAIAATDDVPVVSLVSLTVTVLSLGMAGLGFVATDGLKGADGLAPVVGLFAGVSIGTEADSFNLLFITGTAGFSFGLTG